VTPWDSGPDNAEVYRPALIRGRYRVSRVIHRGRRSDVVRAYDNREGGEVVLKRVMSPSQSDTTRLRTAHRTLSGLHSPQVMGTRELIETRDDAWLVCDHVPGRPLMDWWTSLPLGSDASYRERWQHAAPIVAGLLEALGDLHTHQTPHLDVKPHNVLVGRAGDVHLVDIGLWPEPEGIDRRSMTEIQERSGYAAPELIGGMTGSQRCDQWSLGALVYELITGQRALYGHTPAEFDRAYSIGCVPPVEELCSDVPSPISAALERLLCWDPEERFSNIPEVRRAFGSALGGAVSRPIEVWSAPRPEMVGRESLDVFFRKRLLELRNRKGSVIRIVGGPGTGKTRLLRRWGRHANENRKIQVLSATCFPGRPRTVLHRWFRPPPVDSNRPPPEDLVDQAMERLEQPTVLLLDALEEADSNVWARIQRATAIAVDSWSPKPLIVVLAGRALGGLSPVIDERSDRLFNVDLAPLNAAQLHDLLRPETESIEATERLNRFVHDQLSLSGGNPRALIQGLLAAERAGQVTRQDQFWIARSTENTTDVQPVEQPQLAERVLSSIQDLGGLIEVELALACLPLSRSHLIQIFGWASATGALTYREFGGRWFMEVRDEMKTADLSLLERRANHARAAEWLERNGEFGGLAAERTAAHWHHANEQGRAADAYTRAAKAQARVGSSSDARRLLSLARCFDSRRTGALSRTSSPFLGVKKGLDPLSED